MEMIGMEESPMYEQKSEMDEKIVAAIDKQFGDAVNMTEDESFSMMLRTIQGGRGNILELKEPYKAAVNNNWEAIKQYYREKDCMGLTKNMTVDNDTVFHLAGSNGDNNLLSSLIEIMKTSGLEFFMSQILTMQNSFGNTVLHEVASSGDVSCAETVLKYQHDEIPILNIRNTSGETPIYRAAAFGRTEMVKFLAAKNQDNKIHWMRKDHLPILQVAIQGHHFDTALYLIKYEKRLKKMTDGEGNTCLQLLCSMPYAFKSGYPMELWTRLIYFCLPTLDEKDDEIKNLEECHTPLRRTYRFCFGKALSRMNKYFLLFLSKVYPQIGTIQKAKTEHKLAMKLANKFIQYDATWLSGHVTIATENNKSTHGDNVKMEDATISEEGNKEHKTKDKPPTYSFPLLLATINGILEIVEEILKPTHGDNVKKEDATISEEGNKEHKTKDKPPTYSIPLLLATSNRIQEIVEGILKPTHGNNVKISEEGNKEHKTKDKPPTYSLPLLLATSHGIQEIVEGILKEFPQAIEHVSDQGQNILHVAIRHRKKEIFDYLKNMTFVMNKMVRKIDQKGDTLLHQVGYFDNDINTEETSANPALKLQDELLWFDRVQKLVPPYYLMHYNEDKLTGKELFNEKHGTIRKEAQVWLKDTSQSCSTVAILVAGLVFAAAFTAPTNRSSQFFIIFTITDVIALITSLTSVVMFLSILTSPCELRDFRRTLPWKLVFGFTSLFVSVCATMFTFAATVFLIIDLKGSITRTLVFSLALFPVSLFALMQFPLYLAFVKTLKLVSKLSKKLVKRLVHRKPLFQNEKGLP